MRNKRILITGGTGFLGSRLALAFAPHNTVMVLGRSGKAPSRKIKFIKADVRSKRFVSILATEKFDFIFHLAGNVDVGLSFLRPEYDLEENILPTLRMLEFIKEKNLKTKFVYASSAAVYGACKDNKLSEEKSVPIPISNYGVSKLAAEHYVHSFAKQYGVRAISLRIFSLYGPGQQRQIVFDFIRKLKANPVTLEIIGDGKQARDLVFVGDQVDNMLRIAEEAVYAGEVYNMGSSKLYTTIQIAKAVALAMDLSPRFIFSGSKRRFDGQRWLADNRKIRALGCKFKTSFKDGVRETVLWYEAHGAKK